MANGDTPLQRVNGSNSAKWVAIGVTLLLSAGGFIYTATKVESQAAQNAKDIQELKDVDLTILRANTVPRGELAVQFQAIQKDLQGLKDDIKARDAEFNQQNRDILRELRRLRNPTNG